MCDEDRLMRRQTHVMHEGMKCRCRRIGSGSMPTEIVNTSTGAAFQTFIAETGRQMAIYEALCWEKPRAHNVNMIIKDQAPTLYEIV